MVWCCDPPNGTREKPGDLGMVPGIDAGDFWGVSGIDAGDFGMVPGIDAGDFWGTRDRCRGFLETVVSGEGHCLSGAYGPRCGYPGGRLDSSSGGTICAVS